MAETLHHPFDLSGGNLALDFANTVSKRPTSAPIERLKDYRYLVAFGRASGAYGPLTAVDRLFPLPGRSPERGEAALESAIQLREAIFAIFSAIARRRQVPRDSLALLNAYVQTSAENARIVQEGGRFQWQWMGMDSAFESVLWPIARAAADLLVSEELTHLRICASDECDWLFLDKTKNQRRRWCDMKTCGNRVKARRHYQRLKA